MWIDLVQLTTRDGIRLDGSYQPSEGPSGAGVDAFCLVHGTGGNFYGSSLLDAVAQRLHALGCGVLRINTRGHDGISTASTARGGRRLGAAYEVVDECRHDLAAWIDWLVRQVGPRVGVIGHSLGAVKALYALSGEPNPAVNRLVALSPPRLSYSTFATSPQGSAFLETYTLAQRHVDEGRPGSLLEVSLPLPFVITAAGYMEKYGPDERYNFLKFLPGLPCPTLVTFGSVELENNMAFRGSPEAITPRKGLSVEIVPGADHFYTAARTELVEVLERWLQQA